MTILHALTQAVLPVDCQRSCTPGTHQLVVAAVPAHACHSAAADACHCCHGAVSDAAAAIAPHARPPHFCTSCYCHRPLTAHPGCFLLDHQKAQLLQSWQGCQCVLSWRPPPLCTQHATRSTGCRLAKDKCNSWLCNVRVRCCWDTVDTAGIEPVCSHHRICYAPATCVTAFAHRHCCMSVCQLPSVLGHAYGAQFCPLPPEKYALTPCAAHVG